MSDLKLFTAYFFSEQDEIPTDLKKEILQFIKESNDHELMLLLLDFKMQTVDADQTKMIIETRFEQSYIGRFLLEDSRTMAAIKTVADLRLKSTTVPVKYAVKAAKGLSKAGKAAYAASGLWRLGKDSSGLSPDEEAKFQKAKFDALNKKRVQQGKEPLPANYQQAVATQAQRTGKEAPSAALQNIAKAGKIAAYAAIPAAAGVAAFKIWKNYLSKAAKACKGAPDKESCMARYKETAMQAQLQKLQDAKKDCSSSSSPEKCMAKIDKMIAKKQAKLAP